MGKAVLALQKKLNELGFDPGPEDGIAGGRTARALVAAWTADAIDRYHPLVGDASREVKDETPKQDDLPEVTGLTPDLYKDDPNRPGGCVWTDRGEWQARNLRFYNVPGCPKPLLLHSKAAFRIIVGFGEAVIFEKMPTQRAETFCLRHKNWNPVQSLTTHSYGFAIDFDFDGDGSFERKEKDTGKLPRIIACMERWGLTWGGRWHGKSEDGMHTQACRL